MLQDADAILLVLMHIIIFKEINCNMMHIGRMYQCTFREKILFTPYTIPISSGILFWITIFTQMIHFSCVNLVKQITYEMVLLYAPLDDLKMT